METGMKKNYAVVTLGCQMNVHDGERISGVLESAGWREASLKDADAVIFLTCCVRGSAERRFYGRLSSLKPLKDRKGILIAVGGCLAQKEGLRLLERAPYVDLVFGTQQYPRIAELLARAAEGATCATGMDGLHLDNIPVKRKEDFRAWITITHGCDNFCSYCVVPFVRGREASRPAPEILAEASRQVEGGAREIVLLGQNVNSYRRREEGASRFVDLLRQVGSAFPGVWIRFITSHPRDFDESVIRAIADTPNVCEYVHLPLQSGSDRILAAMNRGYTRAAYLRKAESLRSSLKGVVLSTDIIVGFPGEREEDFLATLEMVESCRFDAAFTFIYNPRPGTAAARLPDDVTPEEKHARMERLLHVTRRLTAESLRSRVGGEEVVLVEGESFRDPACWRARTRGNQVVHFPREEQDIAGKFARVAITACGSWCLHGRLLEVLG